MLVLQARLPAEEGAVALQALRMADATGTDGPAESSHPTRPGFSAETPPTDRSDVSAEASVTEECDVSAEASDWGRVEDDEGEDWPASPLVLMDADGEVICGGAAGDDGWGDAPPMPRRLMAAAPARLTGLVAVAESALATGPTAGLGGVRPEILVHLDLDLLLRRQAALGVGSASRPALRATQRGSTSTTQSKPCSPPTTFPSCKHSLLVSTRLSRLENGLG